MKAIFDSKSLVKALQLVSKVTPKHNVKAILQFAKIEVVDGKCILSATNLELGIRTEVAVATITDPAPAMLPVAKLAALLKNVKSKDVELLVDKDECKVLAGGEFLLPGENVDNFPPVPLFTSKEYHAVPVASLKDMVRKVIFAVASEHPRYAITGVLWELVRNNVRLIGTDGRRLAVIDGPAKEHGDNQSTDKVVPLQTMLLLQKCLPKVNAAPAGGFFQSKELECWISFTVSDVSFKVNGTSITSRLVEGRFPSYREVYPKNISVKVELDVPKLSSLVEQQLAATTEESRKVKFSFKSDSLTLESSNPEAKLVSSMPIVLDGKEMDINLDPKYLLEFLKVLNEKTVQLEMKDGQSSIHFKSGKFSHVLMPLS